VKYTIKFIILFLMIETITDCFTFYNVFAQDPLSGQNKTIETEAALEIVPINDCVEHEYECKNEKAATCSDGGFRILKCINCSFSYKETITAGHNYMPTVIDATCSQMGYTRYTCSYCNDYYKDHYTSIIDHQYVSHIIKEANYFEDGIIEYRCTYCDDSYQEMIPATGHTYRATVVEATCSEKGYTLHICINCGRSYMDQYTPIKAHQYVSVIKKEADCEEDGVKEYRCTYCDDSYEEAIPALGHDYEETVIEATCSEEGYTLHTCKNCNHSYKDHYTPIRVHQYIAVIKKDAGCEKDGVKEYRCTYCDDSYEEAIPASGHDYEETVIEATCSEEGYTLYTCKNCNHSYKDHYTPVRVHQYVSDIKKAADCEEDGVKEYYCIYCDASYEETIPALGHEYGDWITRKEATPLEEGSRYKVCSHNPNHIISETIPYADVPSNTKEKTKEENNTEDNESAVQEVKAPQANVAETKADIDSEKNVQIASDISPPLGTINAMDVFLTALIALSTIGLTTAIMGDVRVIIWDMKLRIKHKK